MNNNKIKINRKVHKGNRKDHKDLSENRLALPLARKNLVTISLRPLRIKNFVPFTFQIYIMYMNIIVITHLNSYK